MVVDQGSPARRPVEIQVTGEQGSSRWAVVEIPVTGERIEARVTRSAAWTKQGVRVEKLELEAPAEENWVYGEQGQNSELSTAWTFHITRLSTAQATAEYDISNYKSDLLCGVLEKAAGLTNDDFEAEGDESYWESVWDLLVGRFLMLSFGVLNDQEASQLLEEKYTGLG
ncbi:hypothetical protein WJX72_010151 [[Myrmecia] bisecta]|uniref:Uncharacterized protein n=1 Tax=[Myrmecia] bisecta TaxID=41462 RepID=A0AAW1PHD6_9CHLO